MKGANSTAQSFNLGGLQWSLAEVHQFLAEHFQRRNRIWKRHEHQLMTYLYHSQVASLASK